VHPEASRFVRCCSDHAPPAGSSDDHRLPAQLRMAQQLDGHEEHVHVDVEDRPDRVHLQKYATRVNKSERPDRPLSALPSPLARAVAFVGILLSGLAGGLIGWALVDLQCSGSCELASGIGMLVGAVSSAAGMSVVAVLVLRAVGEWRELQDRDS
jgi:hypothetical protein